MATIKNYIQAGEMIDNFRIFSRRGALKVEDVNNQQFIEEFVSWATTIHISTHTSQKGISPDTAYRHVRCIKAFLNGCKIPVSFKMKPPRRQPFIYALTRHELVNLLNNNQLSHAQERARDLFLFGYFTGLRFSDLQQLRTGNLQENLLYLNQEKTDDPVIIPLPDEAMSIIEKYKDQIPAGYLLPTDIHSQKYNVRLQKVGEICGIDAPVLIDQWDGRKGKYITKSVPKYKVLTSKLMRKTHITESLRQGIPAEAVMETTGQKDYKSFRRYVDFASVKYRQEQLQKLKLCTKK